MAASRPMTSSEQAIAEFKAQWTAAAQYIRQDLALTRIALGASL